VRHPEVVDFLRGEGLTIIETNGCWSRGSETFGPRCSVNHHTAGAPTGNAPSLGYIIDNVLANVVQSRQRDANGLDVCYLVATGRANHAGLGSWQGCDENAEAWGLEVEHVGTTAEPFPAGRVETSVRVHAAFAKCSRFEAGMVCQHHEWGDNPPGWPGRKQDFAKALLDPGLFRLAVADRMSPTARNSRGVLAWI
jgi:hypothetical protein